MQETTLFFPDISGFTQFVSDSNPEHSAHITRELINVLLDANTIDLVVAEIEGDAVFFYKQGPVSQEQIRQQCQDMFLAFHNHLKKYEQRRICNCGSCAGVVDLKIKFIVHQGDMVLQEYAGNIKKPHGKDVIVAHRLLKNKIGRDEYILYSNQFLEAQDKDTSREDILETGHLEDDQLGVVPFYYEIIDQWHTHVVDETRKLEKPGNEDLVCRKTIRVHANIESILQLILDLKNRKLWNKSAERVEYDENEVNRIGTAHNCIVNGKNLEFETVSVDASEYQYVYGERLKKGVPFKDFLNVFLLNKYDEETTEITCEVYIQTNNFFQRMLLSILKKQLIKNIDEALTNIKEAGEAAQVKYVA